MVTGYRCLKCKKELEIEEKIRCPYCGFRIVVKARSGAAKRVTAK